MFDRWVGWLTEDDALVAFFVGDLLVSRIKRVTGPREVCLVSHLTHMTLFLGVIGLPLSFGIFQ